MTGPVPHPDIPSRAERQALNAALHTTGTETGFWDNNGRPAPWPDDIDEWQPATANPQHHTPRLGPKPDQ
jgi:hypothetical protein